ncbi:hypothetical protein [Agarilytica rhodophyticola]|uniref:hypothetical protein n=1 Tax=Agarilytica rhodophyticola TaxID=1737490 RepID=UPI000B346436|nr:hypothetical protein [Agarilytica rhodophyticola]
MNKVVFLRIFAFAISGVFVGAFYSNYNIGRNDSLPLIEQPANSRSSKIISPEIPSAKHIAQLEMINDNDFEENSKYSEIIQKIENYHLGEIGIDSISPEKGRGSKLYTHSMVLFEELFSEVENLVLAIESNTSDCTYIKEEWILGLAQIGANFDTIVENQSDFENSNEPLHEKLSAIAALNESMIIKLNGFTDRVLPVFERCQQNEN